MSMRYPEPVVGAFIINNENKLFLMKSYKWSNMWVVPGGHIELGETIEQALHREVKEETGLEITDPEFLCIAEIVYDEEFIRKKHMIALNHKVNAASKDVVLNSEGQDFGWFDKEDVMKLPLNKYTKITIKKYHEKIFE